MKTIAIVPAAGYGKRLGLKVKKPFVLLGGRPLVTYALSALDSSAWVDAIVITAEKSCIRRFKDIVKTHRFKKVIDIVVGGKTRYGSVRNALRNLRDNYDIVLIHDAVRPFLEKSLIERSIKLAKRCGGAVVAVPESDTVKIVDKNSLIVKTLDRNKIFRAQTPQAFRFDLIKKAYRASCAKRDVTDDASLVEFLGGKVKIVMGSYRNIKITTKEDLKMAEAFLKHR